MRAARYVEGFLFQKEYIKRTDLNTYSSSVIIARPWSNISPRTMTIWGLSRETAFQLLRRFSRTKNSLIRVKNPTARFEKTRESLKCGSAMIMAWLGLALGSVYEAGGRRGRRRDVR